MEAAAYWQLSPLHTSSRSGQWRCGWLRARTTAMQTCSFCNYSPRKAWLCRNYSATKESFNRPFYVVVVFLSLWQLNLRIIFLKVTKQTKTQDNVPSRLCVGNYFTSNSHSKGKEDPRFLNYLSSHILPCIQWLDNYMEGWGRGLCCEGHWQPSWPETSHYRPCPTSQVTLRFLLAHLRPSVYSAPGIL